MLRGASILVATVLVMAAGEARAAGERAVVFHFSPTKHAQIAIWIEKPDGTFLATVGLTQAVSVRGIGNRPGATQMNSGYHWPYGRREGVLPILGEPPRGRAGRRAVPARHLPEPRPKVYASRSCDYDSTLDTYFCLAFSGDASRAGLDATTCASPFMSDKGRILSVQDVKAGYAEPTLVGGQSVMRALPLVSLYPPRRDYVPCIADADPFCRNGEIRDCFDFSDVGGYGGVVTGYPGYDATSGATPQKGLGYAEAARAAMPDIDAVTMATPPADVAQAVMYSVPNDWPSGAYVAWLEINTEGDYNGVFNDVTFPTPRVGPWDGWAMDTGYPYRGQPSVVFSVPFSLAASGMATAVDPTGYGSVDGLGSDAAMMHAMDGSITDDPAANPGSGVDRLRFPPGASYRLQVEVRDEEFCMTSRRPGYPASWSWSRSPIPNTLINGLAFVTTSRRAACPSPNTRCDTARPRSPPTIPPPS